MTRLEFLSEDVYGLDLRGGKEEFLRTSKERLCHLTVDVCGASFFVSEGVEDSEGRWAHPECKPSSCAGFSLDQRPC